MNVIPSRFSTDILRGWAIVAVVTIHLLSMIPGITGISITHPAFVITDQFLRFSVPLFIVLSGWALQVVYGNKQYSWVNFFTKRMKKIVPLYLLWSVISLIVFRVVPEWGFGAHGPTILQQLAFGQADYQLYFWFVIVQLYAFYPFLKKIFQKFPNGVLISAWVIQFSMLRFFEYLPRIFTLPIWLGMDRVQYVWSMVWLGYFVLGMWLATHAIPLILRRWFWLLSGAVGVIAIRNTVHLMNMHTDPLLALQFTRIPVFFYGSVFSISALLQATWWTEQKKILHASFWAFLGRWSYLIFLNHLIALRIAVSLAMGWLDVSRGMMAFGFWVFGTAMSVLIVQKGW